MATYLHGNSDQFQSADGGLQTLLLMNPSYVQFSDSPPPPSHPNLVYFNSLTAANTFSTQNLSHAPQQFVGIPLPTTAGSPSSHDNNSYSLNTHNDVSAIHGFVPRGPHDIWKAIDPTTAARENARARAQQGLSLSLSSQHPLGFGSRDVQSQTHQAVSGDENVRISGGSSSSASGITNGIQGVLIGSKYLKAAQEILDEVVNVTQNVIKKESSAKKVAGDQNNMIGNTSADGSIDGAATEGKPAAERQEIQMKKGKLMSMLDEVEQRYRKYQQQMEAVKSRFEEAAGAGSGRTYTALAVETISKQFRCIKEAIGGEIKAAKKSLGEEERTEGSGYNHLRQHRAFQHNAWRPQRGLPERSVSILRAWLFQHFLHPYPKDSDKHMLAKQTGLTRSQVSNWFINARVRLWKPMVEEMYMEEIKEQEQNNGGSAPAPVTATAEEKTNEDSVSKSITTETKSPNSKQEISPIQNPSGFTLIGASSELDGITHRSPKKQRGPQILHSEEEEQQNRDGYSFLGQTHFNIAGFGQYPIGEIGRFDADQFPQRFSGNNGVSLTLGLPHCENHLSVNHQNYMPNQSIHLGRRTEIGKPTDYSAINIQNGKSFAAQLLPDFVA